jgi:hypothetical protein
MDAHGSAGEPPSATSSVAGGLPENFGFGARAVYEFSDEDIKVIDRAKDLALALAARPPFQLRSDGQAATRFLVREIMRLFREGERPPADMAQKAVNRFREHLQVQESARRVAIHSATRSKYAEG